MKTVEEINEYIIKTGYGDGSKVSKITRELIGSIVFMLKADEDAITAIGPTWVSDSEEAGKGVIVITNRRIFYAYSSGSIFIPNTRNKYVNLNYISRIRKYERPGISFGISIDCSIDCIIETISFNVNRKVQNDVFNLIQSIVDETKNTDRLSNNMFSIADEIKKAKELMDSGIISQEEFNVIKKRFLNM